MATRRARSWRSTSSWRSRPRRPPTGRSCFRWWSVRSWRWAGSTRPTRSCRRSRTVRTWRQRLSYTTAEAVIAEGRDDIETAAAKYARGGRGVARLRLRPRGRAHAPRRGPLPQGARCSRRRRRSRRPGPRSARQARGGAVAGRGRRAREPDRRLGLAPAQAPPGPGRWLGHGASGSLPNHAPRRRGRRCARVRGQRGPGLAARSCPGRRGARRDPRRRLGRPPVQGVRSRDAAATVGVEAGSNARPHRGEPRRASPRGGASRPHGARPSRGRQRRGRDRSLGLQVLRRPHDRVGRGDQRQRTLGSRGASLRLAAPRGMDPAARSPPGPDVRRGARRPVAAPAHRPEARRRSSSAPGPRPARPRRPRRSASTS